MQSKGNKKLWIILAVIFGVILLVSATTLFFMLKARNTDFDKYKNPAATTAADTTEVPTTTEEETEAPLPENPIDWNKLKGENPDIYAWITVDGTKIDYPIVQSHTDDSFYLRRDYLGNYSVSGCIFTQSMNALTFTDPNTLVYGHYMYDGTFFGGLHNFRNPEFFNENRHITVCIEGHVLTYEIFAAYEYDNRHILLSFDFSDREVFEQYLSDCKNPQTLSRNVKEDVELNGDSRIITLSTCLQNSDLSKRYLVQGVLIKDELTK